MSSSIQSQSLDCRDGESCGSVSPLSSACAVLLSAALCRFFPQMHLKAGGSHSLGFYCDFLLDQPFPAVFLEKIEREMQQMIKEGLPIRSMSMKRENGADFLMHLGHPFIAEAVLEEPCSLVDLLQIENACLLSPMTPLSSTKEMGSIKLMASFPLSASPLPPGEERLGKQAFRILGVVKSNPQRLKAFVKKYHHWLKHQDHRWRGESHLLFYWPKPEDPLALSWLPKGLQLQEIIKNQLRALDPREEIETALAPALVSLGRGQEGLEPFYFEEVPHGLRSSLEAQHIDYLFHQRRLSTKVFSSVREWSLFFLAIPEKERWGLLASCVYKGEQSTILCSKDQVVAEMISSLQIIEEIITILGLEASWVCYKNPRNLKRALVQREKRENHPPEEFRWGFKSLSPNERFSKENKTSSMTEVLLEKILEEGGLLFPFEEEKKTKKRESLKSSAPLVEFELRVTDALERQWPVSSLSLFRGQEEKAPLEKETFGENFVVSRQSLVSLDRVIGLLLEKYEGKLPFWMAPEQVRVIAIGEASMGYASEIADRLKSENIRACCDLRLLPLGVKIYEAEKEGVPFLILVGEQEKKAQTIKVRGDFLFSKEEVLDVECFLKKISSLRHPKRK